MTDQMKCECENLYCNDHHGRCARPALADLKTIYGARLCGTCADRHQPEYLIDGLKYIIKLRAEALAAHTAKELNAAIARQTGFDPFKGQLSRLHREACFAWIVWDHAKASDADFIPFVLTLFDEDMHVLSSTYYED